MTTRKEKGTWLKRRLPLLLAAAGALASGGSMAFPMPPQGSLLVVEYYSSSDRSNQIGEHVYGTCQNSPYPLSWGTTSSYTSFHFYPCEGEGEPFPQF